MAVAGTSVDPAASSDHETSKEPDVPYSGVADPEVVPVSVHSSSYWETVTTSDATFLGVTLATRAAQDGVSAWGHVLRVTLIIRAND